jgi:SAM-dependent methyltransferase
MIPGPIRKQIVKARLTHDMRKSAGKNRAEIFAEIYRSNSWGGEPGLYSSGAGSEPGVIESYINAARALIKREGVKTVVDLGCGDFQVGQRLVSSDITYIGCDIFDGIIEHNRSTYGTDNVQFRVIDIVADPLPEGDLCIIRQVLQHLSNRDIAIVLRKTLQYPLVLITDEQVGNDRADFNQDMLAFHGTRRLFGGGLKLERAPFFQKLEVLLNHSSGFDYGCATDTYLRSVLIRNVSPTK